MEYSKRFSTTEEKHYFYKKAFSLIMPMTLQNLINVGVTATDVILLGMVGETALSGASLAGQIQFIMTLIFFGVTSGASVLIAQYWGKKDVISIEKILGIALRISTSTGILFALGATVFPQYLMRIYTSEELVIAEGVKYLKIVGFSYILYSVSMVYLNVVRSIEKVVISTVIYGASLLINFVLDVILIFGFFGIEPMGVRGAAIGTLTARIIEFLMMLFYAVKINNTIKIRWTYYKKMDVVLLKDFFHYALPVTINEMAWGIAFSMNAAIIGHLGSAAVAANSVAQVLRQLATVVSFGVAAAAAIMVGKAIGEARKDTAYLYAVKLRDLSLICGLGGALLLLVIRPIVCANMSMSELAMGYLNHMILVMVVYLIFQSHNTVIVVGVLRGGGDTTYGLLIDTLSMWCFSIPFGFLTAFILNWDVKIVYMILMSDELVKLPLCHWRFLSKKWLKDVTR